MVTETVVSEIQKDLQTDNPYPQQSFNTVWLILQYRPMFRFCGKTWKKAPGRPRRSIKMARTEIGLPGVDGTHLDQDRDRNSPMRKWTLCLNGAKSFVKKPVVLQLVKKFPAIFMFAPCINDKHFILQLMNNIKFVDTIKIIKYLKVLQRVSDNRQSIIREPCTALG